MASCRSKWAELASGFRRAYDFKSVSQINWFPGHMTKGLRQMEHTMLKTDLLIEVHDARVPISGRNLTFRSYVTGTGRPHILVLNKKDLVFDPAVYQNNKSGLEKKEEELRQLILRSDPLLSDVIFTNCKNAHCPGLNTVLPRAIELIQSSDRYHRTGAPDSNFMIIGVPNVGKSSLINLIRSRQLKMKGTQRVGKNPGVTRAVESKVRVHHDPLVYLLDTPGIMMPNIKDKHVGMKLACCGTLNDDVIGTQNIADYLLFQLNRQRCFGYVDEFRLKQPVDDCRLLLTAIAVGKNFVTEINDLATGGRRRVPMLDAAAKAFLKSFREGRLGAFNFDHEALNIHSDSES